MDAGGREPQWWQLRRAQSGKPATYTCPFCGRRLHAMSEHVLVAPEGDMERRRHAHTECVRAARAAGNLPTYDDWRRLDGAGGAQRWRLRRRGSGERRGSGPGTSIVRRLWTLFGR